MQKIEPHLRSHCGLHVVAHIFLEHRFVQRAAIAHGELFIKTMRILQKIIARAAQLAMECE